MVAGEVLQNISNFEGFVALPNLITNNWFWTVILLVLFFVIYFALSSRNSVKASALAAFFPVTILALLFSFAGLVNFILFVQMLILLSFGTVAFFDWLQA